jgi:hypothetical protein
VQRELVERWLTSPDPARSGAVPVDAVRAERQDRWLESGTKVRGELLRRALAETIEPPPDRPEPLQVLLDVVADTITLTEAQRVPPAIIREIAARLDWNTPSTARSERHMPAFVTLRRVATDANLLMRRGRVLRLSPAGRAAQSDPTVLATAAARAWFGTDEFFTEVGEVAAAVLLDGPAAPQRILDVARTAVAPSWRRPDGSPPAAEELQAALHEWTWVGQVLGWMDFTVESDAGMEYSLTEGGRRAALAGLLRCAYAPRSRP